MWPDSLFTAAAKEAQPGKYPPVSTTAPHGVHHPPITRVPGWGQRRRTRGFKGSAGGRRTAAGMGTSAVATAAERPRRTSSASGTPEDSTAASKTSSRRTLTDAPPALRRR
jgi:hypothetical protein